MLFLFSKLSRQLFKRALTNSHSAKEISCGKEVQAQLYHTTGSKNFWIVLIQYQRKRWCHLFLSDDLHCRQKLLMTRVYRTTVMAYNTFKLIPNIMKDVSIQFQIYSPVRFYFGTIFSVRLSFISILNRFIVKTRVFGTEINSCFKSLTFFENIMHKIFL